MSAAADKSAALQWCFFAISAAGFGLFLTPVFTGILNAGNITGMAFFTVTALLSLLWKRFCRIMTEHSAVKAAFFTVTVIAALLFAGAVIISVFMIKASENKPEAPESFIVLGCRVKGERPSLMLKKRINAAYEYLLKYPEAVCVLSGGQGADEIMSEAECMFRELTAMGISAERLIKEENSTNTYENILFSRKLLEERNISGETAIVTNEFHMLRASLIAKKQGLKTSAVSAPTAFYLLPTYWVRDCLGSAYEIVF